jgi:hypothetical protein
MTLNLRTYVMQMATGGTRACRLQLDARLGGAPRYLFSDSEEWKMQIPDEIRKCVAFVGYQTKAGGLHEAGTCFFVMVRTEGSTHGTVYAVTARHVIEQVKARSDGRKMYLRLNLTDGTAAPGYLPSLDIWKFHPTDDRVDVAVAEVGWTFNLDHLAYPMESFATSEVVAAQSIGLGDDVFVTGLFSSRIGDRRNIPIIRAGNIAAMPEEPVPTELGNAQAYLIECRSIGGLSGSPVFAHLGTTRIVTNGETQDVEIFGGPARLFLLGLMHGHFAMTPSYKKVSADKARDEINMGIAIVVPADVIREVLYQPELIAKRQAVAERVARKELPVTDMPIVFRGGRE